MRHHYGALFTGVSVFVLTAILFSCSTTQPVPQNKSPAWVTDVLAAYPQEQFIAQKGYGGNKQEAKTAGLAEISKYFTIHIDTVTQEKIVVTDAGSSSQIDSNTFVQSQTKLFAVRYTEPWYNDGTRQWETVAYIDRDEAWAIYEPQVRQKADSFRNVYQAAEKDGEPLKQVFLYASAQQLSGELLPLLSFAEILHPAQAAWFDDVRSALSAIPALSEQAKSQSRIFIDCDIDFDSIILSAVANVFSTQHIPVETNKSKAVYLCTVAIAENVRESDAGTFYYPTIRVTVTGKGGVLYAYSTTLNRIGASNPDVAKRRAYTAMAKELQKSLYGELQVKLLNE